MNLMELIIDIEKRTNIYIYHTNHQNKSEADYIGPAEDAPMRLGHYYVLEISFGEVTVPDKYRKNRRKRSEEEYAIKIHIAKDR